MRRLKVESPRKAFLDMMNQIRFCARLIGCDILKPHYRINMATGFVVASAITYYIFTIATIIKIFPSDWKILLESGCTLGGAIQGTVKLISMLSEAKRLLGAYEMLLHIYGEYEMYGQKYRNVLNENCKRLKYVLKIVFVLYIMSGAIMVAVPIVIFLLSKGNYLIMQIHFPGLDITTHSGYLATLSIHGCLMFVAVFGLFASDILVIIYLMQSFVFTDIFKLKIEDFNEILNDEQQREDQEMIFNALTDIVKWHQTYSDFTEMCNKVFFSIVTVMVSTAGIGIIFSLLIILIADWPGAYPYLVVSIYTLYVYCILGTKIEICNDEFCSEIYNISWYHLKVQHQKIVRLMLMKSQCPQTIYVAGVLPLSVSTALQITKSIYTIFMLMVQFLLE